MAQYLHSLGVTECSAEDVIKATIHGNNPQLVDFIRSECQVHGEPCLGSLLMEAARFGRLDLLAQHETFLLSCDIEGIIN
jgi:hypothetical protein